MIKFTLNEWQVRVVKFSLGYYFEAESDKKDLICSNIFSKTYIPKKDLKILILKRIEDELKND